jgi:hypothetical protein
VWRGTSECKKKKKLDITGIEIQSKAFANGITENECIEKVVHGQRERLLATDESAIVCIRLDTEKTFSKAILSAVDLR